MYFSLCDFDLLQGGEGLAAVPEKYARFKTALTQTVDYIEVLQPKERA